MKAQANHVSAVITLCMLLPCQGLWAYGDGTGTRMDPYLIYTPEQMNEIGLNPEDWDKHFKLMEDIDLAAYTSNQFNLIGSYRTSEESNERLAVPFSGVFDGQGHTIANFTYEVQGDESPAHGWVHGFGLFGIINGTNARIKNLTLRDPNLHPSSTCLQRVGSVGALAGIVDSGLITGCRVEGGHIRADGRTGGLVGCIGRNHIDGTLGARPILLHCSTDCKVSRAVERSFIDVEGADFFLQSWYGGMVGYNMGVVSDCGAAGPVSGGQKTGGLVGTNYGEIMHCQATGEVSGQSIVGGLVGESDRGVISSSWASGDVTGIKKGSPEDPPSGASAIGGLLGIGFGDTVSDCYASGHVTGRSSIGGLAGGCLRNTVERCCATGRVSAESHQAGGLVGETSHSTVISECYARAMVSVPETGGGLVGLNGGAIHTSWADGEVSGASAIGGLIGAHWKWQMEYPGFVLEYDGLAMDCYALTNVICEESQGGGLIGVNRGGAVFRCFAAGTVTGSQKTGGLVGIESANDPSNVQQSFWDMEATGLSLSAKGMGLTTQQMQDRTTYIDAGWDFTDETFNGSGDIWSMDPEVAMYPRLAWETDPNGYSIGDVDDY